VNVEAVLTCTVALPFHSAYEGEDCTSVDSQNVYGRDGFTCESAAGADSGRGLVFAPTAATTTTTCAKQTASYECSDGSNTNHNTFLSTRSGSSSTLLCCSDLFPLSAKAHDSESLGQRLAISSALTDCGNALEAVLEDDELEELLAEPFASSLLNVEQNKAGAPA